MVAAAILVFLFILPLLWIDRACGTAPACQISALTDDIWANYSDLSEFKMAAVAILLLVSYFRFCVISIGHVVKNLHVKFHQNRTIFGGVMVI